MVIGEKLSSHGTKECALLNYCWFCSYSYSNHKNNKETEFHNLAGAARGARTNISTKLIFYVSKLNICLKTPSDQYIYLWEEYPLGHQYHCPKYKRSVCTVYCVQCVTIRIYRVLFMFRSGRKSLDCVIHTTWTYLANTISWKLGHI